MKLGARFLEVPLPLETNELSYGENRHGNGLHATVAARALQNRELVARQGPVREMARVLKRHKPAIFREIKRNFRADDALPEKHAGGFGHAAQLQTRKRRTVQRKLIRHPDLCNSTLARAELGWTPGQIGNRLIHQGAELRVCRETIYRCICSKEGMAQELWWHLPERRKSRRPCRCTGSAGRAGSAAMWASCSVRTTWRSGASSATGNEEPGRHRSRGRSRMI
ncbi:hypothetical protein [Mangrovicoccus sp. HB161399]|uniref:hypothetical protein n=1 Tax=Mangrovicoccus sp. HB161399 TaxID=2720392 RepID=UPI0020A67196|nr:hypothetical protein [Mangrovicoccus sp. HB161399]